MTESSSYCHNLAKKKKKKEEVHETLFLVFTGLQPREGHTLIHMESAPQDLCKRYRGSIMKT